MPALRVAGERADAKSINSRPRSLGRRNRLGEFLRVSLGEDSHGWLKATDVKQVGKLKTTAKTPLAWVPWKRAPDIRLDGDIAGRVVDGDEIALTGEVVGRSLRDMYVLLNDRKVYFATGPRALLDPEGKTAPVDVWSAPDDEAVKLPFRVDLRLQEGLNKVLVVARLDEKIVSYRSLFLSRRSLGAVAEASLKAKNLAAPETR